MAQVFDVRLQKESDALDGPPLAGPLGLEVHAKIGQESWKEWEEMQLKVVNEWHLDLSERKDRDRLIEQLRIFLCLDGQTMNDNPIGIGTPTNEPPPVAS